MLSLAELPASPLAFLLEAHTTRTPSLLLVAGASGAGKTAWCGAIEAYAREQHWIVAGLLSPRVMDNGYKVAIDLQDLHSGERRRLATRTQSIIEGTELMPPGGIMAGAWSFDPRTIQWGNDVLSAVTNPDLLIIDELGPLEFRRQQGLQGALKLLDAWRGNLVCVAIRPSLVGAARMRWPWSRLLVVGEDEHD